MTIFCIILGIITALETGVILTGFREQGLTTKDELIELYWEEFLVWVQDARKVKSVEPPYEFYKEVKDGRLTHYVPLANEHNFWLWYLDYKWERKNGVKKSKRSKRA